MLARLVGVCMQGLGGVASANGSDAFRSCVLNVISSYGGARVFSFEEIVDVLLF